MTTYRPPTPADFERLAEIYNYAVRETVATFDTDERAPDHYGIYVPGDHLNRMLVAEVEGKVVAYAGVCPFSDRKGYAQCAETMVYVHPDAHRRGIGRGILQRVHDPAFLDGLHVTVAKIAKDNVYSCAMFEKLGYECKGELTDVGFKFDRRLSVVIYQRYVKG